MIAPESMRAAASAASAPVMHAATPLKVTLGLPLDSTANTSAITPNAPVPGSECMSGARQLPVQRLDAPSPAPKAMQTPAEKARRQAAWHAMACCLLHAHGQTQLLSRWQMQEQQQATSAIACQELAQLLASQGDTAFAFLGPMDLQGLSRFNLTHSQVAHKVGRTPFWVRVRSGSRCEQRPSSPGGGEHAFRSTRCNRKEDYHPRR